MAETQESPKITVAANGGVRPIPDPTYLTTELVDKDIAGLREILTALINGQKDLFEARFDGMDKAIKLLQTIADRMPSEIENKMILRLVVHEEKFNSIQTQFKERDVRDEQTRKDSKTAVDAALQAAKEAVGEQNKASGTAIQKSEAGTAKQIDEQGRRVDDLKERLALIEGSARGGVDATTSRQAESAAKWVVIGGVVAILGLVVVLTFALVGK